MDLGLTSLQAKTYLALVTLGKANVQTIAKASNVARQDVYQVMPTLQKLGLGEKIIAKPIIYEATPKGRSFDSASKKKRENCRIAEENNLAN
jgi:sugar-specific transcriptional regulator TrmB